MAISGPLKLNVQILRGVQPAIGPGKAIVLEAIVKTGSISGAGRALGMSYRRIWLLVSALNKDWAEPVVETQVGGSNAGGTHLTTFGHDLLNHYRTVEANMLAAAKGEPLDWLLGSLRTAG